MSWQATAAEVWQGRDDRAEGQNALRMHQVVQVASTFRLPETVHPGDMALLGFACDEGVRRNHGRPGAAAAPVAIRRALANLAAHSSAHWWDLGDIACDDTDLAAAQQQLAAAVQQCQQAGWRTLVLGGGHETAYGHGLGVFQAHPQQRIGIVNFDAHLDMRRAAEATSGTPFLQLAECCQTQQRPFDYLCVGASRAANTPALLDNAQAHGARVIWDVDCTDADAVRQQITAFIAPLDAVYLTIDLDVLSASQMFAVSAPAALGVPLNQLMDWLLLIQRSGKIIAADVVEYHPGLDQDQLCARVAARLVWQLGQAPGVSDS